MRIIAGQWRGRKIVAPPSDKTRPTTDRVREALFSILASRLGSFGDLRVADLFAGSGALGLEALSRGAAHCTFVEQDMTAIKALRGNVNILNANANIMHSPVEKLLPLKQPHDLILMDPPYGSDFADPVLRHLMESDWIASGGWISVETEADAAINIPKLTVETIRRFGKVQISILRAD